MLGLQPTDDVLAYAEGWLDVRVNHPAARVHLCRDDGVGIGIVAPVPATYASWL